MPEYVLHAALENLPVKLKNGTYAREAIEEPLFRNLSQDLIDSCFNALQKRPPSLSLAWPQTSEQLPMITIMPENMPLTSPVMADDAGEVDEEVVEVTDDQILVASAVGGETVVPFTCPGEPVTRAIELKIVRGGSDVSIEQEEGEFSVTADPKQITLSSALVAGDQLIMTRHAYYGLPGGDLFVQSFQFNYVIFVETMNPLLTSFLVGLVWRELVLRYDEILDAGVSDIEYVMRAMSLWAQVQPAIAFRTELATSGKTDWLLYKRTQATRTVNIAIAETAGTDGTADGDSDDVLTNLTMTADLIIYDDEETTC